MWTAEQLAELLGISVETAQVILAAGKLEDFIAKQTKKANTALERNRDSILAEKNQLEEQVRALKEALGDELDPEQLAEDMAELARRREEKPNPKIEQQLEEQRTQLTTTHAKAIKKLNDEKAALTAQRDALLIEKELMPAIAAEKGSIPLLMPALKNRVKVEVGADGQPFLKVMSPGGGDLLDDEGNPAKPLYLVQQLKKDEDYGRAFEPNPRNGGGGGPGGGRQDGNPWTPGPTWNLTEQSRLEKADPAQAKVLKAQAGR